MSNELPKLWTEEELADYLGVSTFTVGRERRRGNISYTLVGEKIRFTNDQIVAYLRRNEIKAKSGKD